MQSIHLLSICWIVELEFYSRPLGLFRLPMTSLESKAETSYNERASGSQIDRQHVILLDQFSWPLLFPHSACKSDISLKNPCLLDPVLCNVESYAFQSLPGACLCGCFKIYQRSTFRLYLHQEIDTFLNLLKCGQILLNNSM